LIGGLLGFGLMLAGCKKDNLSVKYADGSGNLYVIISQPRPHLSYRPVSPALSSSGIYHGGEPVERNLEPTQIQALRVRLEAALKNQNVHIQHRVKMSGALEVYSDEQTFSVILSPGCAEQVALEKLLQTLKQ